jgi:DNA repair protein RadD
MDKRDYQEADLKEIEKRFEEFDSIMYQLPTGGGKSAVSSKFVENRVKEGKRVLIIAHRRKLIDQMKKHNSRHTTVGVMVGKEEHDIDAQVLVASVWTISKDDRMKPAVQKGFDYIVVDEAHRTASNTYESVLNAVKKSNPNMKLLGLSATPLRRDKKDLSVYYKHLIQGESVASLISKGFLADFNIYATPVHDLDFVKKSGGDYNITELSKYMRTPERITAAVLSHKKHSNGQTIVFCVDTKHAMDVLDEYKNNGYTSIEFIGSATPEKEREDILTRFENGKLEILVGVEILIEGVDLPETQTVQLLRPTKSLTYYLQMVGRGLRPKSSGEKLVILDNAGCSFEHGMPDADRDWSLLPTDDTGAPKGDKLILVKRKNGKIDDDIDDLDEEGLELVEMTREEYAEYIGDDLERIREFNAGISSKINKKKEGIWAKLDKLMESFGYRENNYSISMTTRRYESRNRFGHISFERLSDGFAIKPTGYMSNETAKMNKEKYELIASLYNNEIVSEVYEGIISTRAEIEALENSKVDESIAELKLQEANKQKLVEEIESIIESVDDGVVEFSKQMYTDSLFAHISYYERRRAFGIKFKKKTLLQNNPIELIGEHGDVLYSTKSAKLDKILDIYKWVEGFKSK